jgi:hypothetical protein
MTPSRVSVVVASGAGGEFLFRCLASLREQVAEQGAELIVVDRCGAAVRERIAREHPHARVLAPELGHRPSVPELRREGLLAARGEVVAVLEEHCTAPAGWLAAIESQFEPTDAAIGGPILDDDFARLRDWVVYFSEYHNYMPPWQRGERALLNGANIAYDRARVLRHQGALAEGYWEVVLHPPLMRDGRFRAVPEMGARHTGPFDYGYYLRQRYLLSRVWGGSQRSSGGLAKRIAHLLAGPIFPLFLLARIASRVLEKGTRTGKFLQALPLLVPVVCAYTLGEWLGYLIGTGDALEEVE